MESSKRPRKRDTPTQTEGFRLVRISVPVLRVGPKIQARCELQARPDPIDRPRNDIRQIGVMPRRSANRFLTYAVDSPEPLA